MVTIPMYFTCKSAAILFSNLNSSIKNTLLFYRRNTLLLTKKIKLSGIDVLNIVDAGDLILMPGLVDSHVHVNEPGKLFCAHPIEIVINLELVCGRTFMQ